MSSWCNVCSAPSGRREMFRATIYGSPPMVDLVALDLNLRLTCQVELTAQQGIQNANLGARRLSDLTDEARGALTKLVWSCDGRTIVQATRGQGGSWALSCDEDVLTGDQMRQIWSSTDNRSYYRGRKFREGSMRRVLQEAELVFEREGMGDHAHEMREIARQMGITPQ